jgi:hypothetical protein
MLPARRATWDEDVHRNYLVHSDLELHSCAEDAAADPASANHYRQIVMLLWPIASCGRREWESRQLGQSGAHDDSVSAHDGLRFGVSERR